RELRGRVQRGLGSWALVRGTSVASSAMMVKKGLVTLVVLSEIVACRPSGTQLEDGSSSYDLAGAKSGNGDLAGPGSGSGDGGAAPTHFSTLPPHATLPTEDQCAAWVAARPTPETIPANATANATTPSRTWLTAYYAHPDQDLANNGGAPYDLRVT